MPVNLRSPRFYIVLLFVAVVAVLLGLYFSFYRGGYSPPPSPNVPFEQLTRTTSLNEPSTPVAVFSRLLKLKQHHIGKLQSKGETIHYERLLGEIITDIDHFPSQLNLQEQGMFAIGYYHQRQDFYTKKASKESEGSEAKEEHHV